MNMKKLLTGGIVTILLVVLRIFLNIFKFFKDISEEEDSGNELNDSNGKSNKNRTKKVRISNSAHQIKNKFIYESTIDNEEDHENYEIDTSRIDELCRDTASVTLRYEGNYQLLSLSAKIYYISFINYT
jgi:hypothetical protein